MIDAITVDLKHKTVVFSLSDFYDYFQREPGYCGEAKGTLTFGGIGNLFIDV